MITEIVDLDLGTNSSFKIMTMQGDVASRFIEFHLTYNNEVFDLTGKTVSCRYLKDDKTVNTTNLVINDKLNGVCTLDIPHELMENPYIAKSELVIKQSNDILSTIPFTVEVVKSLVKSSVVESTSEFGALNDALWKIDGVDNRLNSISSQLEQKAKQVDLDKTNNRLNSINSQLDNIENNLRGFINIYNYYDLVVEKKDSSGEKYLDWYIAIQTAINENDKIYLPKGKYELSAGLKIPSGKYVFGVGRESELIAKNVIDIVVDCGDYINSVSYTTIDGICVNGNNLAKKGFSFIYFTNGSCAKNLFVWYCTQSGIYATKLWYSSFENIMSTNNTIGLELISTAKNDTYKTDNINAIEFNNLFIRHNTTHGIKFSQETGYSNLFNNCTIENNGEYGVYIYKITDTITFKNCYFETHSKYAYYVEQGKTLILDGGYVNNGTDGIYNLYTGSIFMLIINGTSFSVWNSAITPPDYFIYTQATKNIINATFLSTPNKRDIYFTGQLIGNTGNVVGGNGSNPDFNISEVKTSKIKMLENLGYNQTPSSTFEIGSNNTATVDSNNIYKYKLGVNGGASGINVSLTGVKKDNTEQPIFSTYKGFMTLDRGKMVTLTTENRPTDVIRGAFIFDDTLRKPIVYNGTQWVDFMGNPI